MKTNLFILALIFVYSATSVAKDTVGNGSDASQQNVLFAYSKLEKYINICFQTDSCRPDKRQYDILSKILNGLHRERLNREQIQFESEINSPGFFTINSEVQKAKTGSEISSSIYINKDLLGTTNDQGVFESFSIEQSIALLIHELGHHYGDYSHAELDILGVKVASVVQKRIYSTPSIPWNSQIYATVVNGAKNSNADVLLYIFDDIFDISKDVKVVLTCGEHLKTLGFILYNLHWVNPSVESNATYTIQANALLSCQRLDGTALSSNQVNLNIEFGVLQNRYTTGSLKITRLQ